MTALEFRRNLRRRLLTRSHHVLLRVALPNDGGVVAFTGEELVRESCQLVKTYVRAQPGSVVLVLLPHTPELFLFHLGLVLEGYIPAVLPWPTTRMDKEKYYKNLVHQLQVLKAQQLLTVMEAASQVGPHVAYPATAVTVTGQSEGDRPVGFGRAPAQPTSRSAYANDSGCPEEALFLQFSGGTTGNQKAVVVTARMLSYQLDALASTLAFSAEDSVVSWLPMYHDMGLIACLWLPLWNGAPSCQIGAIDWLLRPERLFTYLEEFKGTFCWLPNFAFSYLASNAGRMNASFSLAHVRAWVNCSEPIHARASNAFAAAFASSGVVATQLQASYAMAENVFAVAQTPLGQEPATFPRRHLRASSFYSEARLRVDDEVYVSSGRLLPGMQARVVGKHGESCGDCEPGNIQIRTPCLFAGYWSGSGFNNAALSPDGWYTTGDFGFVSHDDIYVIGRLNDMIIVGGQNVFPEDIESIVNEIDGVYTGRVVAFGITEPLSGTDGLAVIAEMRGCFDEEQAKFLERQIRSEVLSTIGIAPRYVRVVRERWIVKSTAGKISRSATSRRFADEFLSATVPAAT